MRGPRRSVSPLTIDRLLAQDLHSRPPVADWLTFLVELLAAEAIQEFTERGGIE
jgi:hypothetical protein